MGMFDPPKPKTEDTTTKELPEAGIFPARFVWMLDLGTVDEPTFDNPSVTRPKHQILLGFELSGAKMKDGRPFMVSERFTITNGKFGPYCSKSSKLRDVLKSWQGWDEKKSANLGNLAGLLGGEALLNVAVETSKKGTQYTKITAVMPLPKGMKVDKQTNPIKTYEVGGDGFDDLPSYIQDRVKLTYEFNKKPYPARTQDAPTAGENKDIPF